MAIIYETEQRELKASKEENLLDLCLKNEVNIDHSCEGGASCGTCRVIITRGLESIPDRNPLEQDMADDRSFKPEERLACQIPANGSFQFYLPNDKEASVNK